MKRFLSLLILAICALADLGRAQIMDLTNTNNGACNAPCKTITFYYSSPAIGELFIVEGGWAGTGQAATISDGVNTFHSIAGPSVVGTVATQQIWYAVNTGSPLGITISVPNNTPIGWFDGMFFEVIGLTCVNDAFPIDTGSIGTNAGTGRSMAATSGALAANGEQVWGIFLQSAAGSPYVTGTGWNEVGGGEAVSAILAQVVSSTAAQTPNVTSSAPTSVNWTGAAFAVNAGTGGTGGGSGGSSGGSGPTCESALTCYVRAGAAGNNTGIDWFNAYTELPASLVRGGIYYVAAGTYPGHLFDDEDSGTLTITIRAATIANHGAPTGWNNSYAGQAVFNSTDPTGIGDIWTFDTDFYTIDGVSRSTATGNPVTDWTNEAAYGFKIDNATKIACNADISLGDNPMNIPLPVHDITIQFVDVNGSHETVPTGCRENGITAMWGSYNYTIQYNYVHDLGLANLFLRGGHENCNGTSGNVLCGDPASGYGLGGNYGPGNNMTVVYNYFARTYSDDAAHAEGCSCSEGLQNLTMAFNYWQDISGTAVIATPSAGDWYDGNGGNGPWYIYGNVFWETSCTAFTGKTAGVAGIFYKFGTTFIGPIYFLNNTIFNFPADCNSGSGFILDDGVASEGPALYRAPATDIRVENNLWVDAAQITIANACTVAVGYASCTSIEWDHNAYFASPDSSGGADLDPTKQIGNSIPFVTAGTYNFVLAGDTAPGADTGAFFTANGIDLLGIARAENGTWERGALQLFTISPSVFWTGQLASRGPFVIW